MYIDWMPTRPGPVSRMRVMPGPVSIARRRLQHFAGQQVCRWPCFLQGPQALRPARPRVASALGALHAPPEASSGASLWVTASTPTAGSLYRKPPGSTWMVSPSLERSLEHVAVTVQDQQARVTRWP